MMLILEMNRAGMVNRGLTGYATGFSIGAVQTAAASYKETGKIDWEVVWKNANSSGLVGLTTGAISGMADGKYAVYLE